MNQTQTISSFVNEQTVVEMVFDPTLNKTSFAVYDGQEVHYQDAYDFQDQNLTPIHPHNDLLQKRVVLFPSEASDYGEESNLINKIQDFVHRYVHVSDEFEKLVPYYVLLTWAYDKFQELPYLRVIGDYGSGKTRFLQAVGSLCYKPIFTAGATTTAPIFRLIDRLRGTLIMDEADFRHSDMSSDIIKILNSGYAKGFPVIRCEGKGVFEERTFEVFGPKILATRETFTDQALESRFLVEHMGRSKIRRGIPRNLTEDFHREARDIRNMLLMWRFRNHAKPVDLDRLPDLGLHPRLEQISSPLLSIIESESVRDQLMQLMKWYNQELLDDRGMSWESQVLEAIVALYKAHGKLEYTVNEITAQVNESLDFSDDKFQARRVGWILRTKLHLKTRKRSSGYCLSLSEQKEKFIFKCERYGVESPFQNDERLNVVNVIED